MIEKLQIRGHGTNKKLDISFSPYVTTIVGRSYIGKSWILRALRWVCLNKPAGDSFINWDSNEAKGRLSIDGNKIIRTRSKSINTYKLSGKEKPYVAFGNDVPKDIAEIVNLAEINFQGQHATPFWFCETAGEVSRQLNSIVNLKLIDSTLAEIDSQKRKADLTIKITEATLVETVEQKKELAYVEDLNRDLTGVEKLWDGYETITRKRVVMAEKIELVAKYGSIRENRLELASDGLKAMSVGRRYRKIADSAEKLSRLVYSALSLRNLLKNKPPSFTPIEKLKEKSEQIHKRVYLLGVIVEGIEDWSKQKCQMKEILKTLTKELEENIGKSCPLCGQPINKIDWN